jgi:hypothetical protein
LTQPITDELEVQVGLLDGLEPRRGGRAPREVSGVQNALRLWAEPYRSDSSPMTEALWSSIRNDRVGLEQAEEQLSLAEVRLYSRAALGTPRDGLRTERRVFAAYLRAASQLPLRGDEQPYAGSARTALLIRMQECRARMLKVRFAGGLPYSASNPQEVANLAELEGRIRALSAALADTMELEGDERCSLDELSQSFFDYRELVASREAMVQAGLAQASLVKARVTRGLTEEHLTLLRTLVQRLNRCP